MLRFEQFDLKITKLTGNNWDRSNMSHLLIQLYNGQGNPRHSIENRVIIAFDQSPNSSVDFLRMNEELLIRNLIDIAYNPYDVCHFLSEFNCWGIIKLIPRGEYQPLDEYCEHPLGLGLREKEKAEFERQLILKVAPLCNYLIKPPRYSKLIGIDGEIKLDILNIHRSQCSENNQLKFW